MFTKLALLTEQSNNLKISSKRDYSFAKNITQLPISLQELYKTAVHYPFFFIKNPDKSYEAIALFSLTPQKNRYIDAQGNYSALAYIPQVLHNYPFTYVLHEKELSLAYQQDDAYISPSLEVALFDQHNNPTQEMQTIVERLNSFEQSKHELSLLIKTLDAAGILSTASHKKPMIFGDVHLNLQGFLYVDEQKLATLKEKQLLKLVRSLAYNVALTQLISLNNLDKLTP